MQRSAHNRHTALKPFYINPQNHVKIWFSPDGFPAKHQARLIKFRQLNPDATIRLIYADKYLTSDGRSTLTNFAKQLGIILVEYDSIQPYDDDERKIKAWIDHELETYFTRDQVDEKGNLSVVSDQLRLFHQVISFGLHSDCDVEFNNPLPKHEILAPLGIIARIKDNGTHISNDLTTGNPQHPVFIRARSLVVAHNLRYHNAVPGYFSKNGIEFDPSDYKNHPKYYQARNKQLSSFSLGGGPQILVIACHQCGIATGYEGTEDQIFQVDDHLVFRPYQFIDVVDVAENELRCKEDFAKLFPVELGPAIAHWDTSWKPGEDRWKKLTVNECVRLYLFKLRNDTARALNSNTGAELDDTEVKPDWNQRFKQ